MAVGTAAGVAARATSRTTAAREVRASLAGVTVRFGGHVAVDDLSLEFESGRVHALLGENGAGKSTAVNVLFGLVRPDAGAVLIDGEPRRLDSPRAAIAAGFGMVHQHFALVDDMTVLENVVLGAEPDAGAGLVDFAAARAALARLGDERGIVVAPDARVADLAFGARQGVEVAKALYRDARVLVLDEPTAVLTPGEIDALVATLRRLAADGVAVVLITHKLDEVLDVADRVSVMRKGRLASSRELDRDALDASARESLRAALAREIVGGVPPAPLSRADAPPGMLVLRARGLEAREGGLAVGPIDLDVRRGEIVAIAGVAGNGQGALVRALVGLEPVGSVAGRIELGGADVTGADVAVRRRAGLCYVPEDRQSVGLALDASVAENACVGRLDEPGLRRGPFLARSRMRDLAARLIERYRIAVRGPGARARTMSGGNRQKLVVARELAAGAPLVVAENPTWGVDVGAIAQLHAELVRMRDAGRAILVVSSELDEVLALADRTLVMSGGRVVAELDRAGATREAIGAAMTGVGRPAGVGGSGGVPERAAA